MKCKIVTCINQKGNNKVTGKPFDFYVIGALITTARGTEFAEFMYDTQVEMDKWFDMELSFYPNQKKQLSLRVENLRSAQAPAAVKVA